MRASETPLTVGAHAVDPKAACQTIRAWRAYSRDLERSCSGASVWPHKAAASIIALMFALGLARWYLTLPPFFWR